VAVFQMIDVVDWNLLFVVVGMQKNGGEETGEVFLI